MKFNHLGRISAIITILLFNFISPVAAVNITAANTVTIVSQSHDYVPFEIWILLFALTWICLALSLWKEIEGKDMWALLAAILAAVVAWLSAYISFNSIQLVILNDTAIIQPVQCVYQTQYIVYIMWGVFLVALINVFRVIWLEYLKPIRDDKLEMQGYSLNDPANKY
ncbi:MAG: hypothetical protein M0R03_19785 [Novosphingobium sp.]|nr:hypothetical protein [Novosphingobium sp.]